MNVLVDMHVFDGKHQGTRTYLKGIYKHFLPISKGINLFFAANDISNLKSEFGAHNNLTYVPLKKSNKFYRIYVEFPKIIAEHNIDYAHFQYISPFKKHCKYIVTTHDILFQQNEFKSYFPLKYRITKGPLFRLSARRATILLTVSEYSKKVISERYNIQLSKIFVTPNAIDTNFNEVTSENTEIKKLGKFILYVSRIEPRKNHLLLLKGFLDLELYKKGYTLVLIGATDILDKKLEQFIAKHQTVVNKHVIWKDNVPFEQVKAYYKEASLFVFPSLAEGFGIPILEAMAFNTKVLVSNATAMSDFNLPEELSFNPYDYKEFKAKLLMVLESEKNYEEVYKKIIATYDWAKSAAILKQLLVQDHAKQ